MILGIDYGTKHIGLAVAEEGSKLVLPAGVIENTGQEKVLIELEKIIQEKDIKIIVVGLPLSLSGEQGPKAQATEEFAQLLRQNFKQKIETVDERMTSRAADALSAGTKGSRDIGSAMVILEGYIARNFKSQNPNSK
jgi:putative Holliday junction resolvase